VVWIVRDTTQKSETEDYVWQTIHESIAGIVQNNVCLFYNPWSWAKQVANLLKTTWVSYVFKEDRGFPTYEVIVQIQAIVIGDR
jgi:hypothetical protein